MAEPARRHLNGQNLVESETESSPRKAWLGGNSLRARLLILMAGLLIVGVVSQSTLINNYLLKDFRQLEASQLNSSLHLIQLWLDRFVQPMEGVTREAAASSRNLRLSDSEGIAALEAQLMDAFQVAQSFDVAAVYDTKGNPIFVRAFEGNEVEARPPTESSLDLMAHHSEVADHGREELLSGWSATPNGLFATASHSIEAADGTYNVVLGLDFDALSINSLDQLSGTRITTMAGTSAPGRADDQAGIACSRLSPRLNPEPQLLCVQLQESILLRGQRSVADLRLLSLMGFILLMVGAWWFTDRNLLRRLSGLTRQLDETHSGQTGQLENAMLEEAERGDEIARLSNGFGRLLGRVRQAEHDLRQRERSFRVLAESSGVAIFVVADVIRYANPYATRLSGLENDELIARNLADLIHENSRPHLEQAMKAGDLMAAESRELCGIHQNGTHYWAKFDVARIEYQGEATLLITLVDITEQRHLEQVLALEKQNLQLILNSIHDGIVSIDHTGAVKFINPAAQRLTGIPIELAHGSLLEDVVSLKAIEGDKPMTGPILDTISHSGGKNTLAQISTSKGQVRSVEVSVSRHDPETDEGRQGSVLVLRDVSDLRQLTQTLSMQASHDDLTSLINRREFSRRLLQAIETTRDRGASNALCYMDLDQFKLLNDTCGHHAGDLMLREVADALGDVVPRGDTLARLGGDEFGILLSDCTPAHAEEVANVLRETVCNIRFQWNGQSFSVDASIGIVMLEHVEGGIDEALALADAACYMAKDLGRNRIQVYRTSDVGLQQQLRHMRWATRLKEAVEKSQFTLFAQPIEPVSEGVPNLHSFEALVRMKQPDGKIVTPEEFLSAAERYQMMNQIDRWVVSTALDALQRERAMGRDRHPLLFINLSGQSLGDESFRHFLLDKLEEHKNLVRNVVFEVTESAVIYSLDRAKSLMDEVYARGSAFALDDFGTGMSTFSYLKELRVDYLKIAGCFVKNIDAPLDAAVCQSFTDFAHMMNVKVIAEWIEDETVLKRLQKMGVEYGQGWHLGRPAPIDEALKIE